MESNDLWKRNYATNNKMDDAKVLALYDAFKRQQKDEFELAQIYGISVSAVYNIVRGRSWKWLGLTPVYRRDQA